MVKAIKKSHLAVGAAVLLLAWLLFELLVPAGFGYEEPVEFTIAKGDGSAKVARLLAERGLIRSRYLFLGYTVLIGQEKNFQAGRYLLSRSMSIAKIVTVFSRGLAESDDIEVTIPEGFNLWEVDKKIAEAGLAKPGELFAQAKREEGYLFPDTYRFEKDTDITAIIEKIKSNFIGKTGQKVSEEKLIIASLLEKEVREADDMALVAGIIYKRLNLGMKLQIDAAVAYGACLDKSNKQLTTRNSQPVNSRFRYCDVTQVNLTENIKIDSPYNTYLRKGLPPSPIANPGLVAINAALHPKKSDYLYYLSAKDGRTVFSKTPAEHERNRLRYLK